MTADIFILAGEASGDLLASRIMRAVNANYGQHKWVGLGGDHMIAEGLQSVGEMQPFVTRWIGRGYSKLQ